MSVLIVCRLPETQSWPRLYASGFVILCGLCRVIARVSRTALWSRPRGRWPPYDVVEFHGYTQGFA